MGKGGVLTRCQHCNKLTHSEDLYVKFHSKDFDKIYELTSLEHWTPKFMYSEPSKEAIEEYGKLKCGDIYIHFLMIKDE